MCVRNSWLTDWGWCFIHLRAQIRQDTQPHKSRHEQTVECGGRMNASTRKQMLKPQPFLGFPTQTMKKICLFIAMSLD